MADLSRHAIGLGLGVLLATLASSTSHAEPVRVGIVAVDAPKGGGAKKIGAAIRLALKDQGLLPVMLAAGAGPSAAEAQGLPMLITVTVKKTAKTRFSARGRLIAVADNRTLKVIVASYAKGTSAKAGAELGAALGQAAASEARNMPASKGPVTPRLTPIAPPPPAGGSGMSESEVPPPPPPPRVLPKDESGSSSLSTARPRPEEPGASGEDQLLRFSLGLGSQVASAYTVAVGGQVTGLAYELTPLFLLAAGVRVKVPDTGLSLGVDLSFVPVKYVINIPDATPPVDPAEPSGRFLAAGVEGAYELVLVHFGEGGRFGVAPRLGGRYASMSVESQGDNTVITSYSGADLYGGLRASVLPFGALAIDLELEGGLVLGYSESPTTTGESGSGFLLAFGGGGRYWISSAFGLFFSARYQYRKIGFSGVGNRVQFMGDPMLIDASVQSGDLKLGAGALLAL